MHLILVLALLGVARSAYGQPAAPAVVHRLANDHVTVRAVRVQSTLRVDGRLDEDFYATVPAISDFIQQEPQEGQPATEKTRLA